MCNTSVQRGNEFAAREFAAGEQFATPDMPPRLLSGVEYVQRIHGNLATWMQAVIRAKNRDAETLWQAVAELAEKADDFAMACRNLSRDAHAAAQRTRGQ